MKELNLGHSDFKDIIDNDNYFVDKYYKKLIDNKIAIDKIIKVPIVFAGKEAYINRINN